jgi:hypothetical protein
MDAQCMHLEALQKAKSDVRIQHLSARRRGGFTFSEAHVKHVTAIPRTEQRAHTNHKTEN